MRGYIEQRSKGSYHLRVYVGRDPQTGKRRYRTETVKGAKRDAQKRLAELVTEINHGVLTLPSRIAVKEYLLKWLDGYAKVNVSPRTYERYEEICRVHLIPSLGAIPLASLQPVHIQDSYAKTLAEGRCNGAGGLSKRTVNHHHRVLYEALKNAVRQGLIVRNPAEAVTPPRPEHVEMKTLDAQGLRRLLQAAEGTAFYVLFYTAAYTGLRRSELLGLRWERVDADLGTMEVVETLHRLRSGEYILKPPKSQKGRRRIALPPQLAILLRDHKAEQEATRQQIGLPPLLPTDFVFSEPDGSYIDPDRISKAFRKVAQRIGFAGRFHDLRHTHATLMLAQNVHPKIVQERLGHANIALTLDTYSHKVQGMDEAAALKFGEELERHKPTQLTDEEFRTLGLNSRKADG